MTPSSPVDLAKTPFCYTYKDKFYADVDSHSPLIRKVALEFDPTVLNLPKKSFQKFLDLCGPRVRVNGTRREFMGRFMNEKTRNDDLEINVRSSSQEKQTSSSSSSSDPTYTVRFTCASFPSSRHNREYIDRTVAALVAESLKEPFPEESRL